eukprot:TRINITY_DN2231_c0_g1_i2.p1 TRINITY_DN2231_c0_g1~~TRINITY_DN2231_c0_g1_i2.p1  ORF type:complete len:1000 (+),score=169.41 TRINITY_DN2231_c0_g1_i2:76-3075(+)
MASPVDREALVAALAALRTQAQNLIEDLAAAEPHPEDWRLRLGTLAAFEGSLLDVHHEVLDAIGGLATQAAFEKEAAQPNPSAPARHDRRLLDGGSAKPPHASEASLQGAAALTTLPERSQPDAGGHRKKRRETLEVVADLLRRKRDACLLEAQDRGAQHLNLKLRSLEEDLRRVEMELRCIADDEAPPALRPGRADIAGGATLWDLLHRSPVRAVPLRIEEATPPGQGVREEADATEEAGTQAVADTPQMAAQKKTPWSQVSGTTATPQQGDGHTSLHSAASQLVSPPDPERLSCGQTGGSSQGPATRTSPAEEDEHTTPRRRLGQNLEELHRRRGQEEEEDLPRRPSRQTLRNSGPRRRFRSSGEEGDAYSDDYSEDEGRFDAAWRESPIRTFPPAEARWRACSHGNLDDDYDESGRGELSGDMQSEASPERALPVATSQLLLPHGQRTPNAAAAAAAVGIDRIEMRPPAFASEKAASAASTAHLGAAAVALRDPPQSWTSYGASNLDSAVSSSTSYRHLVAALGKQSLGQQTMVSAAFSEISRIVCDEPSVDSPERQPLEQCSERPVCCESESPESADSPRSRDDEAELQAVAAAGEPLQAVEACASPASGRSVSGDVLIASARSPGQASDAEYEESLTEASIRLDNALAPAEPPATPKGERRTSAEQRSRSQGSSPDLPAPPLECSLRMSPVPLQSQGWREATVEGWITPGHGRRAGQAGSEGGADAQQQQQQQQLCPPSVVVQEARMDRMDATATTAGLPGWQEAERGAAEDAAAGIAGTPTHPALTDTIVTGQGASAPSTPQRLVFTPNRRVPASFGCGGGLFRETPSPRPRGTPVPQRYSVGSPTAEEQPGQRRHGGGDGEDRHLTPAQPAVESARRTGAVDENSASHLLATPPPRSPLPGLPPPSPAMSSATRARRPCSVGGSTASTPVRSTGRIGHSPSGRPNAASVAMCHRFLRSPSAPALPVPAASCSSGAHMPSSTPSSPAATRRGI